MRPSTSGGLFLAMFVVAITFPSSVSGQIVRPHIFDHASPYTAEYKSTHTQRLADGNLINLESKEVVAVDSEHRHMTARSGALVPDGSPLGTRFIVIDPVAQTMSIWTSPGQRVTINTMPELGAARGCPTNKTGADVVNLGHNSGSKPLIEDLGTDTIQGVEAHGRRITTTIPAGEIGNAAPLVRTRETWMAVAPTLQGLVVRENSDDPRSGQDDKGTRQPRSAGAPTRPYSSHLPATRSPVWPSHNLPARLSQHRRRNPSALSVAAHHPAPIS